MTEWQYKMVSGVCMNMEYSDVIEIFSIYERGRSSFGCSHLEIEVYCWRLIEYSNEPLLLNLQIDDVYLIFGAVYVRPPSSMEYYFGVIKNVYGSMLAYSSFTDFNSWLYMVEL